MVIGAASVEQAWRIPSGCHMCIASETVSRQGTDDATQQGEYRINMYCTKGYHNQRLQSNSHSRRGIS